MNLADLNKMDAKKFAHQHVKTNDKITISYNGKKVSATAKCDARRTGMFNDWWLDVVDCNGKKHLCKFKPTQLSGTWHVVGK